MLHLQKIKVILSATAEGRENNKRAGNYSGASYQKGLGVSISLLAFVALSTPFLLWDFTAST